MPTYFAYHLTHVFGSFDLDTYHTNSSKPREGDVVYVVSGDKDPDESGVDYSLEGVFRIRRLYRGPWKLPTLDGHRKDYQYRLQMETVRRPDDPIPLRVAPWYSREEIHRYFSSGQNFNPLPRDRDADYGTRFDQLLSEYGSNEASDLVADLAQLDREIENKTERDVLAKARVGQGRFRAELIAEWGKGETCALTGVSVPEMLIASHVKPWRESSNRERLDPMNGILLVSHADRLFDQYLMSFQEARGDLVALFHPRVRDSAVKLGLKTGMRLDTSNIAISSESRLRQYLAGHLQRHMNILQRDTPPVGF